MRISWVTYGSDMRNHGRWSITRSSIFSLPCSASCCSAAAVNALVLEAIANSVCASTRAGWSISRRPKPCSITTWPSFTIATAMPGTSKVWRTRST